MPRLRAVASAVIAAIVIGLLAPHYGAAVLLLGVASAAAAILHRTSLLKLDRASVALLIAVAAMLSDWLNPDLVGVQIGNLKWGVLAVPVAMGLSTAAGLHLLVSPSLPGRFFLGLLVWTLATTVLFHGFSWDLTLKWVSLVLLYLLSFVALPALRREGDSHSVLSAIAWVGIGATGSALASYVLFREQVILAGRLRGIFANPLMLGMLLDAGALCFLTLAVLVKGALMRLAFVLLALVAIGLLVLTGSREGIVGLMVGLLVLAVGFYREWSARAINRSVLATLFVGFLGIQALAYFQVEVSQGLLRKVGSESMRLALIRDSIAEVRSTPINTVAGIGLGVVRQTAEDGRRVEFSLLQSARLENSYLELLVETGGVGLVLGMCALVSGLLRILHQAWVSAFPDNVLGFGVLAICTAGAAESAFNSVLFAPGGVLSLWVWGLIGTVAAQAGQESRPALAETLK